MMINLEKYSGYQNKYAMQCHNLEKGIWMTKMTRMVAFNPLSNFAY